jgi:chromosomal replication initiation ATPase DnaA
VKAVILDGPADAATIATIRRALAAQDETVILAPVRVGEIVVRVGYEMGLSPAEIGGRSQGRGLTRARAAVAWLAVKAGRSLTEIGRVLGDREHTTMLHHRRVAEKLRAQDPAFRALTDRLQREFEESIA